MSRRGRLYSYLLCALFAALTAICSQIMIPLPFTPVPVNLALLAVWVCGGLLGAKKGAVSILVYLLLGCVGVPVFVGFAGGLGVLAGPTGGYAVGYLPAVVIYGLLAGGQGRPKNTKTLPHIIFAILKGLPALAACYAMGTVWFVTSTGTGLLAAMVMCVIPFIPGDILKLFAAAAIIESLRKPIGAIG